MSPQRALAFPLLLGLAAACAPVSSTSRSAIAPQLGPKASIYASYTGGLFDRSVHAWFRVEREAYVMVAHLSGEGVIRVVYPGSPRDSARIAARQSFRTSSFFAPYDAVPSLYSFVAAPIRNPSALISSYDGRGHGYIFLIASDTPLHFDEVSESGLWDEIDVVNYHRFHDPRLFVRDFADMVTAGEPYTLRFAQSYSTTSFTSYASAQMDCFVFCSLPLAALASLGYYYGYGAYGSYCSRAYSLIDAYFYRGYVPPYNPGRARPITPVPVGPSGLLTVLPGGGPRVHKADTATVATRPEGDVTTIVPPQPRPRRAELPAPAGEETVRPSRTRSTESEPESPRPRRRAVDRAASEVDRIARPRPVLHDTPARAAPRAERTERPRPERIEHPRPERVERPQVERTAPPPPPQPSPRVAPSSTPVHRETPPSPPPPRPKPEQP